jgi:hypothetical protein
MFMVVFHQEKMDLTPDKTSELQSQSKDDKWRMLRAKVTAQFRAVCRLLLDISFNARGGVSTPYMVVVIQHARLTRFGWLRSSKRWQVGRQKRRIGGGTTC